MNKSTIEDLGIDLEEIKERIVKDAARQIADTVGKGITHNLILNAQNAVNLKVNEVIDEVLSQTFQPVNTWGEKTGEPTTIRALMEKSVSDWWNEKVDSSGRKSTYGTAMPRAEYFAKQVVAKQVDYNVSSEMKKIIDAGKEKVREAMSKAVAEQIKKIW